MATEHHDCAASDCHGRIPVEVLFCALHTELVPEGLQRELLRMWRRYLRGGKPLPFRFFQARREAVAAVARLQAATTVPDQEIAR